MNSACFLATDISASSGESRIEGAFFAVERPQQFALFPHYCPSFSYSVLPGPRIHHKIFRHRTTIRIHIPESTISPGEEVASIFRMDVLQTFTRHVNSLSCLQDDGRKVKLREQLQIEDVSGMTLLIIAVRSGSIAVVRALLNERGIWMPRR